ncbi:hypothetical protein Tco_1337033 [Tanacetum coccineum]
MSKREATQSFFPKVNTGRFKLNIVNPLVNTTSSNDQDSPKDMLKLGASHTLEATHVEFFSDEDEPEVDFRNITNSYTVPITPNTRIHKDHLIKNVIGDVKSSIKTRRKTKSTSEQGEPTSIAKALSDSSWVEVVSDINIRTKTKPKPSTGMERSAKVNKSQSQHREVKVKDKAEAEDVFILNGPPRTQVNGPSQPIKPFI